MIGGIRVQGDNWRTAVRNQTVAKDTNRAKAQLERGAVGGFCGHYSRPSSVASFIRSRACLKQYTTGHVRPPASVARYISCDSAIQHSLLENGPVSSQMIVISQLFLTNQSIICPPNLFI